MLLRQGIDAPCRGSSTNNGTEREGLVSLAGEVIHIAGQLDRRKSSNQKRNFYGKRTLNDRKISLLLNW